MGWSTDPVHGPGPWTRSIRLSMDPGPCFVYVRSPVHSQHHSRILSSDTRKILQHLNSGTIIITIIILLRNTARQTAIKNPKQTEISLRLGIKKSVIMGFDNSVLCEANTKRIDTRNPINNHEKHTSP